MALVKCVECKKEISSSVKVCPHCGKKDPTFGAKEMLIGFMILVFMVIFINLFIPDSDKKNEDKKVSKTNLISENRKNDASEKDLYEIVKKIPASDFEKNQDGYRRLIEINPENQIYKDKYNHYSELIKNKKSENELKILKQSNKFVRELIESKAITVDNNSFRVFVEPGFWNMMDYRGKEAFCSVVQNSYPRHSIVDKFSGKRLAELTLLGDIKIIE